MSGQIRKLAALATALVLVLGVASTASAQVFTGRIDVTIEDATGGRLPGVSVDLTGPSTQTQVTDAQGQAHFLNLPVGTYTIKAAAPRLQHLHQHDGRRRQRRARRRSPVKLGVAGTPETVNVTAATPIIDIKRETTTTNVTLEELQNIPSARDPWVVMQTVPTVYMDRVNVGGSESGQQSNYNAQGRARHGQHVEHRRRAGHRHGRDRLVADLLRLRHASRRWPSRPAAPTRRTRRRGVQLNMVLKKGSNSPHGDARIYFENQSLQAVEHLAGSLAAALGDTTGKGNRTDKYNDYGFDLGGPLLKDRLWAWGTHGAHRRSTS